LSLKQKQRQLKPSSLKLTPTNIKQGLEKLLSLPKKRAQAEGRSYIGIGISMIKPEVMAQAIRGEIPTDAWLTNHFHLGHPLVRPLWSLALKVFWTDVEDILTDVGKVYRYAISDPQHGLQNKALLDTPEGIQWLNSMTRYFYTLLRLYTFDFNCPICGNYVDAINHSWIKYPNGYFHIECIERRR
jgi:hypothetical protein